ncbi:hypothetical protein ACO0K9_28105, partial [Undibacterium sp. Ji50W]|uniref:hypothetical protein n=1 Tax=Undibacterium sp. Ji50W TaxID=3413041 RepID=UPI003BF07204
KEITAYAGVDANATAKVWLSKVVDAATLATAQTTVDTTIAAIVTNSPGSQIVLTNGTDIVSGETFTAPQVYTPGGNARINSLQDEDQLTGTGVSNTL